MAESTSPFARHIWILVLAGTLTGWVTSGLSLNLSELSFLSGTLVIIMVPTSKACCGSQRSCYIGKVLGIKGTVSIW